MFLPVNKLPQTTQAFWVMNIGATIPDNSAGDLPLMARPFGANVCDFLSKPHEKGGLDFGIVGFSVVLAGIVLVMIVGVTWAQNRYGRQGTAALS